MKNSSQKIEIARCTKPHGIKGAATLKVAPEYADVLQEGKQVELFALNSASSLKKGGQKFTISKITFGHKVMCYFKEVTNRNQIEDMIPFTIDMSREEFGDEFSDEVFASDLVGLKCFSESQIEYGIVEDYYDNGAQLVLVVSKVGGGQIDIPYVEQFFIEVDLENKKAIINPPRFV